MPQPRPMIPLDAPIIWEFAPESMQLRVYAETPTNRKQWVGTVILDHKADSHILHKIAKRVFYATFNLGVN